MEENKSNKGQPSGPNNFLKYSGIGVQMIATIGLGAWAGVVLDRKFGYKIPVFTITLLLLAVGGSMYLAIKDVLKNN